MNAGTNQAARPARRRWPLLATVLVALVPVLGNRPEPVGAADVNSLQQRIATARSEARKLAGDLQAKQVVLRDVSARAGAALARERQLSARLAAGQGREARLRGRVAASERRLAIAERRLARARRLLADRLVAIYKSDAPDLTTVVLQADGFDDLLTRVHYWDAINRSDSRLAGRVRLARGTVRRNLSELRRSRDAVVAHNRRLGIARDQIARVRARADAEQAALARARAAQAGALQALRGRISGWVSEVQRLQRIEWQQARALVGGWFGDFSIPVSIVMCESGGNYRAVNPHSGAGGAYQITPETWRGLGGRGRPQDASKAEQDRLASRLWAGGAGRGNWAC